MSSLKPWMPTSAVRNSWLTIDMNSLFNRLSFSRCGRFVAVSSSDSLWAVTSSNVAMKYSIDPSGLRLGVALQWTQNWLPSARLAWQSDSYVSADPSPYAANDLKTRET